MVNESEDKMIARRVRQSRFRSGIALVVLISVFGIAWFAWAQLSAIHQPIVAVRYNVVRHVYFIAFSPDETQLVSCGFSEQPESLESMGVVTLWDLERAERFTEQRKKDEDIVIPSQKCITAERSFDTLPFAAAFTPDGNQLIVGTGDAQWGLDPERESGVYSAHGSIRCLDAKTLEEQKKFDLRWGVYGLAISPDGARLAAVGSGERGRVNVGLFDLIGESKPTVLTVEGNPAVVGSRPLRPIQFSHDGKRLYVATVSAQGPRKAPLTNEFDNSQKAIGKIAVIEPSSLKVDASWNFPAPVTWIDISPDDKFLAVNESSFSLPSLWRLSGGFETPQKVDSLRSNFLFLNNEAGVFAIARRFHGANLHYVAGVYSYKLQKQLVEFNGGTVQTASFALSPKKRWVAIGNDDGLINAWKIPELGFDTTAKVDD